MANNKKKFYKEYSKVTDLMSMGISLEVNEKIFNKIKKAEKKLLNKYGFHKAVWSEAKEYNSLEKICNFDKYYEFITELNVLLKNIDRLDNKNEN